MPTRSAPWPWRAASPPTRSWPNCCRKRWTPEHAYLGRCRRLPGGGQDILFRAAQRAGLPTLVANQPLRTPPSPLIRAVQVPRGFDVADAHITQHAEAGDLVITADIRWRPTCWPGRDGAQPARRTLRRGHDPRTAGDARHDGRTAFQRVDIGGPPASARRIAAPSPASSTPSWRAPPARPRNPALDSRPRVPRAGSARASSPVN